MKKVYKIIIGIFLSLIIIGGIAWFAFLKPKPLAISEEDRAQINLIPLPSELVLNGETFEINANLGHLFENASSPKLKRSVDRFYTRLSNQTGISFTEEDSKVLILDCKKTGNQYPSLKDDESYELSVSEKEIRISANSETGISYGLESLLQLIKKESGKWVIPTLDLKDEPRFPWRGLLIDAGRHWIPKEVILRNLDAMLSAKMNVLHWHLTEHQGFRIESKVFPKLHEMGSNGNYYTQEDIKEIVSYAADRGIRVVPEFDLPGHSISWFVGYPELASTLKPYQLATNFTLSEPVMNPAKEEVYSFLADFFEEMTTLFPDEYFHIGGDEASSKHWDENPEIQEFMKSKDFSDPHELQAYFNIRLQAILKKQGKKMLGWDEIMHPDLPKDGIVVQSWRDQKSLWEAARNGNKALLSSGYYLDHKQSADFHYKVDPLVIPGAVTVTVDSANWKEWDLSMSVQGTELEGALYLFGEDENLRGVINSMGSPIGFTNIEGNEQVLDFEHESTYGNIKYHLNINGDSLFGEAKISFFTIEIKGKRTGGSDMESGNPLPKFDKIEPLTTEQEANILGGEACMWTEMVDQRTIDSRIWPRSAAIAEKLWSSQELTTDSDDMYRRLMVFSDQRDMEGLMHIEYGKELISNLAGKDNFFEPLSVLIETLQEDKLFNRMLIYEPELLTTSPLNRVVDAASAENYDAYKFKREVSLWKETENKDAEARIIQSLEKWAKNHDELSLAFQNVKLLKEVEQHSENLAALARICISVMQNPDLSEVETLEINVLLEKSKASYGGTILAVIDGLEMILIEHI